MCYPSHLFVYYISHNVYHTNGEVLQDGRSNGAETLISCSEDDGYYYAYLGGEDPSYIVQW